MKNVQFLLKQLEFNHNKSLFNSCLCFDCLKWAQTGLYLCTASWHPFVQWLHETTCIAAIYSPTTFSLPLFLAFIAPQDASKLWQMTPSQWNTPNAAFAVEDSSWSWLTLMVELPFGSLDEVFWEATGPSLFMTSFLQRHYLTLTCPKAHKQAGNHCEHGATKKQRISAALSGQLDEPGCVRLTAGMSRARRSSSGNIAAQRSQCASLWSTPSIKFLWQKMLKVVIRPL